MRGVEVVLPPCRSLPHFALLDQQMTLNSSDSESGVFSENVGLLSSIGSAYLSREVATHRACCVVFLFVGVNINSLVLVFVCSVLIDFFCAGVRHLVNGA